MQGPPVSPCTKVCVLDAAGYCVGCLRTGEEIAGWSAMGAEAQWRVIRAVAERKARLQAGLQGEIDA
jgi:predicted Fe-S protein YdhL (DUF1289 family)